MKKTTKLPDHIERQGLLAVKNFTSSSFGHKQPANRQTVLLIQIKRIRGVFN